MMTVLIGLVNYLLGQAKTRVVVIVIKTFLSFINDLIGMEDYMEQSKKQVSETFSVEEGYIISTVFFLELWPLVEPKITEKEEWSGTYSLFFVVVCSGGECSAEWNEAVRRAMNIPKEDQKTLQLTIPQVFSCALEFCKLHNERYENNISYAVDLLKEMQKKPEFYPVEWNIWKKIIEDTKTKHIDIEEFDWSAELPTWTNENPNIYDKGT